MKFECTVEELKELIKKEQTECKSECSIDKLVEELTQHLLDAFQSC